MTPRRTGDIPTTKPSPYRLPLLLGAAGVILLVLGFSIPGWGWLAWLGFLLLLVAALSYRWWFWFSAADWRLV